MARRSDHSREELERLALDCARQVVIEKGIGAFSGRKVTARMGYTIGTLYQIFADMDDLVERMNVETLDALYDHCRTGAQREGVAAQLKAFGLLFGEFVRAHPREWEAVMAYRFKDDHVTSEAYDAANMRLFGLMKAATREFYAEGEDAAHAADMAVLWASLTGVLGVTSSARQVGGMTLDEMIDHLIGMYLAARRPAAPQASAKRSR